MLQANERHLFHRALLLSYIFLLFSFTDKYYNTNVDLWTGFVHIIESRTITTAVGHKYCVDYDERVLSDVVCLVLWL